MKFILYLICLTASFYAGAMEKIDSTVALTPATCIQQLENPLSHAGPLSEQLSQFIADHMTELLFLYPHIEEILKKETHRLLANQVRNHLLRRHIEEEKSYTRAQLYEGFMPLPGGWRNTTVIAPFEKDTILTGHEDGSVWLRSTATGKVIRYFKGGIGRCISLTSSKKYVVAAFKDRMVSIWRAHDGEIVRCTMYDRGPILALGMLSPEKFFICSSKCIDWQYIEKAMQPLYGWQDAWGYTTATALSEDVIAFADKLQNICVRSTETGKNLRVFTSNSSGITHLLPQGNEQLLSCSQDGNTLLSNRKSGPDWPLPDKTFNHKEAVLDAVRLNDDSFATISTDKRVRIWALEGTLQQCIELKAIPGKNSLAVQDDTLFILDGTDIRKIPFTLDALLKKEAAILASSPVLREKSDEIRPEFLRNPEAMSTLFTLMKEQCTKAYTGLIVSPHVIKKLIEAIQMSEKKDVRLKKLFFLLTWAKKLKLDQIECSIRFFICNYMHNVDPAEQAFLPENLKELGCYGVKTNDNRFFLLDKGCAQLVPYLTALFETPFKEGLATNALALNSVSSRSFDLIKRLLNTIYRNTIHCRKFNAPTYVPQKKLLEELKKEKDIPLEAIMVADEWCQPQIAHALLKAKIVAMSNEELADFVQEAPECLRKYLAPEIVYNPEQLPWQPAALEEAMHLRLITVPPDTYCFDFDKLLLYIRTHQSEEQKACEIVQATFPNKSF